MTHYANSKGGRHYAAEYRDNENSVPAYLPALIFVGFIFTMAIWFLFNPKLDYSSSEKRNLQQFPETSVPFPRAKHVGRRKRLRLAA